MTGRRSTKVRTDLHTSTSFLPPVHRFMLVASIAAGVQWTAREGRLSCACRGLELWGGDAATRTMRG